MGKKDISEEMLFLNQKISILLAVLRRHHGHTLAYVADRIGMTTATLSRAERFEHRWKLTEVNDLLELYRVDMKVFCDAAENFEVTIIEGQDLKFLFKKAKVDALTILGIE